MQKARLLSRGESGQENRGVARGGFLYENYDKQTELVEKVKSVQVMGASNFNEYVAVMAANSPHGLMMDLWRRLELAVFEYLDASGSTVNRRNRSAIEEILALDPAFGSRFVDSVRRIRVLRNRVAHQPIYHHSPEEAIGYAKHAFALIGAIGRRVSCLERAALTDVGRS